LAIRRALIARKAYLGAVMVLVSALRCGVTLARMRNLEERVGVQCTADPAQHHLKPSDTSVMPAHLLDMPGAPSAHWPGPEQRPSKEEPVAKRRFIPFASVISLALVSASALAQAYPTKPLRGVVGFAAGGQIDALARIIAQKVSEGWGQQLVIDNRPGAGSNIAAEIVAKAPPDGYTLYFATQAVATNPVLMKAGAVDPVKSLAPVSKLATAEAVLMVHNSLPVHSLKELISYAKGRPGQLNFATTSIGSPAHVGMEILKSLAGIEIESILYKNVGQAATDVASGRVAVWMTLLTPALPLIKGGQVRVIAVTGHRRLRALPEVPTIKESGFPTFESSSWYGLFAPAGTPRDITVRVSGDIRRALDMPDVQEKLAGLSVEPLGSTPEQLTDTVRAELARVQRLVKTGALTPN
jgi:tripartite-type tricarboxylate transporter receptor subunit TctC